MAVRGCSMIVSGTGHLKGPSSSILMALSSLLSITQGPIVQIPTIDEEFGHLSFHSFQQSRSFCAANIKQSVG